ncbi:HAMP domain-containing sensor histidine kinase [Gallaecimonas kandeliae]|uniref:sensor histidine kinase n=1 Tax=Gallaecimonas kandeliae TaxID=3029055 RepID=UPI0026497814|nr:HAMP domain-containing sensor histidine kinase [Gallaecimonas kandeliae]WKE65901.1 HAMP domain-containing sensor histidine kinase [Gallaecimonas kandeliae]
MTSSFERRLGRLLLVLCLPAWGLFAVLGWQMGWSLLAWLNGIVFLGLGQFWLARRLYQASVEPWPGLQTLVEGINQGDASYRLNWPYRQGHLAQVARALEQLSNRELDQGQRRAQQHLLFDELFRRSRQPLLWLDGDDSVLACNDAALLLGGLGQWRPGLGLADFKLSRSPQGLVSGDTGTQVQCLKVHQQGQLLMLFPVSQQLARQEVQAWQRLIRVFSHEVRNSMTPIQSYCEALLEGPPGSPEELRGILAIIDRRARGLLSFVEGYARLAKLPPPQWGTLAARDWLQGICALLPDLECRLLLDAEELLGDGKQLEQLLLNLLHNAQEAALGKPVTIHYRHQEEMQCLLVEDQGPGFANLDNLMVPLYSTKPKGSGIGLALCRQILMNHGGRMELGNHQGGAQVRCYWPLP